MDEILDGLLEGETLYTTSNGTNYRYVGRDQNLGIIYSINQNQKTLPLNTLRAAIDSFNDGDIINRQWYLNFNHNEYESRPCNLSVLNALLDRSFR